MAFAAFVDALRLAAGPDRNPLPGDPANVYGSVEDDDDWPPRLDHQTEIKVGDGSRYHFLGTAEALERSSILDAGEIPGNPACKYAWRIVSRDGDKWFQAVRVGKLIAVTLLDRPGLMRCVPLRMNT